MFFVILSNKFAGCELQTQNTNCIGLYSALIRFRSKRTRSVLLTLPSWLRSAAISCEFEKLFLPKRYPNIALKSRVLRFPSPVRSPETQRVYDVFPVEFSNTAFIPVPTCPLVTGLLSWLITLTFSFIRKLFRNRDTVVLQSILLIVPVLRSTIKVGDVSSKSLISSAVGVSCSGWVYSGRSGDEVESVCYVANVGCEAVSSVNDLSSPSLILSTVILSSQKPPAYIFSSIRHRTSMLKSNL